MTRTHGAHTATHAAPGARAGQAAAVLLRMFTWVMIGLFVGTVLTLILG
jgi:hypothetical protein